MELALYGLAVILVVIGVIDRGDDLMDDDIRAGAAVPAAEWSPVKKNEKGAYQNGKKTY